MPTVEADPADEQAPLLGTDRAAADADAADAVATRRSLHRLNTLILTFAIIFFIELAANMMVPPMNAAMEEIICRAYHPELSGVVIDPDSDICKGPDVQGKLAMMRGWALTFSSIPSILLAVPYGIMSDKWGRRPVLFLALLGLTLAFCFDFVVLAFPDIFPLWTIWLDSICLVVGGGSGVAAAVVYTIVNDVVAPDERASYFFRLTAVDILGGLLAGPAAGFLLLWSPWLTIVIALALAWLVTLSALALPETNGVHQQQREPDAGGDDDDDETSKLSTAQVVLQKARTSLKEVWDLIIANKRVAVLVSSLVVILLGRWVQSMLLQYATKRYHWSWSKASFFLTIGSASNLVVLLVVLPLLDWFFISRLGLSTVIKDLRLARISAAVSMLGSLIIAFAANGFALAVGLFVLACGSGLVPLVRSLASALVEQHHIGTLNSMIAVMQQVALMAGGPLLSSTLGVGYRMGGAWIGLPFICTAIMFGASLSMLLVFRLPARLPSAQV